MSIRPQGPADTVISENLLMRCSPYYVEDLLDPEHAWDLTEDALPLPALNETAARAHGFGLPHRKEGAVVLLLVLDTRSGRVRQLVLLGRLGPATARADLYGFADIHSTLGKEIAPTTLEGGQSESRTEFAYYWIGHSIEHYPSVRGARDRSDRCSWALSHGCLRSKIVETDGRFPDLLKADPSETERTVSGGTTR
ncbi:hypothetical protein Tco_0496980 [Tanacetum coccineum]